jgi:hypothetical protein
LQVKAGLRPGAKAYQFPTSANPYIDPEEIEQARLDLPEGEFAAFYLAIVQDDGAGAFPESHVYDAATVTRKEPWIPQMRCVLGADLAKQQDYTVAVVINTITGGVVAWLRVNKTDWSDQVSEIVALAREYHAPAVIEANGPGDPVIDFVRRQGIEVRPIFQTNLTKNQIISDLRIAFEQHIIKIPTEKVWPELFNELLQYEHKYTPGGKLTFGAADGWHDDTVMGLAMAWWAVKNAPGPFLFARALPIDINAGGWGNF